MANGKRTLTGSISSGQTLTGFVKGGSGIADHSRLTNRATKDQHPIEAITGLRTALDTGETNLKATEQELKNLLSLEASLRNTTDEELAERLAVEEERSKKEEGTIKTRLDTIEGEADADGSIKKALADAKVYTDGEVDKLEAKDEELSTAISDNTTAIETETAARKTAVAGEKTARENADNALNTRLEDVEAFFKTTEEGNLDEALDTLKEIQDYLNNEGSATGGLIGRISENERDIKTITETAVSVSYDGEEETLTLITLSSTQQ
jgi:hypothetical protein